MAKQERRRSLSFKKRNSQSSFEVRGNTLPCCMSVWNNMVGIVQVYETLKSDWKELQYFRNVERVLCALPVLTLARRHIRRKRCIWSPLLYPP